MTKGGVDHHGDLGLGMQVHEGRHRLVQLREAGHLTALGCNVGAVDHDVVRGNGVTHLGCVVVSGHVRPLSQGGTMTLGVRAVDSGRVSTPS